MAVPYASEDRFREAFNTVEAYIERRYDLPVVISDVTDPYTGDLDGAGSLRGIAGDRQNSAQCIIDHGWNSWFCCNVDLASGRSR